MRSRSHATGAGWIGSALALGFCCFAATGQAQQAEAVKPFAGLTAAVVSSGPTDAMGRPLVEDGDLVEHGRPDGAWVRATDGSRRPYQLPPIDLTHAVELPGDVVPYGSLFTLAAYQAHSVGSSPSAVAIGDVTGDGLADVVMTTDHYFDPLNDHHVFVFRQLDNGLLDAPVSYAYGATANRNGIALVDLNQDCLLDVVVGHQSGLSILLADGTGGLQSADVISGNQADTLAATDVDLDGSVDLVALSWSSGAQIFFGDGQGGLSAPTALATNAAGYNDHEVADLNDDGFVDLAVMSGQGLGPKFSVHLHNGIDGFPSISQTYTLVPPNTSFSNPGGLGLGDVSGDGLVDAVLSRPKNSPTNLWILTQDASGILTGPTSIDSYDIPEPVEVADLDGDGDDDVVVLHGGWNRAGVYRQGPSGLFPEQLYSIPYASHYHRQGLAIGDFTGDACGDVAIADYNHGLVTLSGVCPIPPSPVVPDPCVPEGDGGAGGGNDGGSGQGGSDQGGANQGGTNQGGANQGGTNQGGNANQGGSNQGGTNQGGGPPIGGNTSDGGSGTGGNGAGGRAGTGGGGEAGAQGVGGNGTGGEQTSNGGASPSAATGTGGTLSGAGGESAVDVPPLVEGGGCECSVVHGRDRPEGWLLFGLATLLLRRRRKPILGR